MRRLRAELRSSFNEVQHGAYCRNMSEREMSAGSEEKKVLVDLSQEEEWLHRLLGLLQE